MWEQVNYVKRWVWKHQWSVNVKHYVNYTLAHSLAGWIAVHSGSICWQYYPSICTLPGVVVTINNVYTGQLTVTKHCNSTDYRANVSRSGLIRLWNRPSGTTVTTAMNHATWTGRPNLTSSRLDGLVACNRPTGHSEWFRATIWSYRPSDWVKSRCRWMLHVFNGSNLISRSARLPAATPQPATG